MKKFTKEQLADILHKNILQCDLDEVKFLFNIFALSIKEFSHIPGEAVDFEIHFKRVYIMRTQARKDCFTFDNEYIDFHLEETDADTHGITSPLPETMADVIVSFINIFTPNVLKNAGYEVSFDPRSSAFESLEEAQDYLVHVQKVTDEIISARKEE